MQCKEKRRCDEDKENMDNSKVYTFFCLSVYLLVCSYDMSSDAREPDFCLGENKGADQLCSKCTADQRLCLRYLDSTIPLLVIAKC